MGNDCTYLPKKVYVECIVFLLMTHRSILPKMHTVGLVLGRAAQKFNYAGKSFTSWWHPAAWISWAAQYLSFTYTAL